MRVTVECAGGYDFAYSVDELVLGFDFDHFTIEERRKAIESLGPIELLAKKLGSHLPDGLGSEELSETSLRARRSHFGRNEVTPPQSATFWSLFLEAWDDRTMIFLLIAAIISLIFGLMEDPSSGWIEGTAILIALLLVTIVTAANDYSKEKQFQRLFQIASEHTLTVIRGGEPITISSRDVVVGDIVMIRTGDKIEADGIMVSGSGLKVDESTLTGESEEVSKEPNNTFGQLLFTGTLVAMGEGAMLVLAVGENTTASRLTSQLTERRDTPLQKKLVQVADSIGLLGILAAALTGVVLGYQFFNEFSEPEREFEMKDWNHIVDILITCITIVVVAVPEGLPLAVTIALAYSMFKMLKDNNYVRRLEACETMGGATCICSDKTGTLTQNKMTVVRFFFDGELKEPPRKAYLGDLLELLLLNIQANSSATIGEGEVVVGSKTDGALLLYAQNVLQQADYHLVRNTLPVIQKWPFNSLRKRMDTIFDHKGVPTLLTKGASEVILSKCTKVMHSSGAIYDLDETARSTALASINSMTSNGLRTLTLAFASLNDLHSDDFGTEEEPPDVPLTLLAICGIQDPVREEVPDAIRDCVSAGIKVRMVTGDNIDTARFIAKDCGILTKQGIAMEGEEFRQIHERDPDRLKLILPRLEVIARCSPRDKYRLVSFLIEELGEVVAVTGDGTNDAPALSLADVGFAMGIAGTDVAKQAAAITILDDNFVSIVSAVKWGRNVYDSIRKFIQFQLTVNLVAILIAVIGAITDGESPLKAVQLLWVNLIMDTLAALALATETPTDELLQRQPYGRTDALICPTMWRNIVSGCIYQLAALLITLWRPETFFKNIPIPSDSSDTTYHMTLCFNVFVACTLFNEICSRRAYNELWVFSRFFSNSIFISILFFTAAAQFVLVEYAGSFASTAKLSIDHWITCIIVGAISIPWGILTRLIRLPTSSVSKRSVTAEEKQRSARRTARLAAERRTGGDHWTQVIKRMQLLNQAADAFRTAASNHTNSLGRVTSGGTLSRAVTRPFARPKTPILPRSLMDSDSECDGPFSQPSRRPSQFAPML